MRLYVNCVKIHEFYFVFLLCENSGGTAMCCEEDVFSVLPSPPFSSLTFNVGYFN